MNNDENKQAASAPEGGSPAPASKSKTTDKKPKGKPTEKSQKKPSGDPDVVKSSTAQPFAEKPKASDKKPISGSA